MIVRDREESLELGLDRELLLPETVQPTTLRAPITLRGIVKEKRTIVKGKGKEKPLVKSSCKRVRFSEEEGDEEQGTEEEGGLVLRSRRLSKRTKRARGVKTLL